MKIVVLIVRILLGLVFLVFGANIIHSFLPMPPMTGDAADFMRLYGGHGLMNIIGLIEVIGGVLLLVGRFVPLALVLLGPIIVNILMFHAAFAPSGMPIAIVVTLLEVFLLVIYRKSFYTLFYPAPEAL